MSVVLFIGQTWPEPSSTAAGARTLQLINLFEQYDYKVVFASDAQKTERSEQLSDSIVQKLIKLNDDSFDAFAKALNPSIVVYDRFNTEEKYGWRIREQLPEVSDILDTQDLHSLRDARRRALSSKHDVHHELMNHELTYREISSILRTRLNLIISEFELSLLKEEFSVPQDQLFYLPLFAKSDCVNSPSFENRADFMHIGNFLHKPNLDAVRLLKQTLWPRIKQRLPEARLFIYGPYAPASVQEMHDEKSGCIIGGAVENLAETYKQHRVLLAPLRFGAGLKGKLMDAMAYGTPAVMTSIAAEGLFGEFSPSGVIAKSENDFIHSAVELYKSDRLWGQARSNGVVVLEKRFNQKPFKESFKQRIQVIKEESTDFTFNHRMLNYNAHNALKFKSRWIGLKNSNQ